MKSLDKIKAAHDNFKSVQLKLSKFGACDTEPDYEYQHAVRNAIQGKPFEPLTANKWQLYTCDMKCEMAAKRLNFALQRVVNAITCAPISELETIGEWFAGWGWRVEL